MWREVAHAAATSRQRRRAHRRLAVLVDEIEERARHRALGSVSLDSTTRSLLLAAASSARTRGAPETSVELLELAVSLGATDSALRIQLARDHLESGEPTRALDLANDAATQLGPGPARAAALHMAGVATYQVADFPGAARVLEMAFLEAAGNPSLRADIAVDLCMTISNCGRLKDGLHWARRSVAEATDGKDAGLLAEAQGGLALLSFMNGQGLSPSLVDQALAGEDTRRRTPATRWPSVNAGLLSLWSHDLSRARQRFEQVRARCVVLGTESGLWLALGRAAEAAVWDGDIAAARDLVTEMTERAVMAGSRSVELMALAAHAYVSSWCGSIEEVRVASDRVVELGDDDRHMVAMLLAMACRGMAELSDDDPVNAAAWLSPLADTVELTQVAEPVFTPFVSDAIEAFVRTGQAPRAERLVGVLQGNRQRPGRSWPAGVAARGRGVLLADEGAVNEAADCYRCALSAHDGPGLRYERARTLLLLGRLERRRRQRSSARDALQEAALLFDQVGAARWAANAREEGRHLGLPQRSTRQLTPTEQRVAELVASGLTNVAVAARLSISPKTVEANLSRVYRKLGIRSRAQLGRWAAEHD
jgi:DNA-binding CsgD family transcriptional regulator